MVAATIANSDRVFMIEGAYALAGTSGVAFTDNDNCQFIAVKANGDFDPTARVTIDASAVTSGAGVTIGHDNTQVFGIVVNDCGGTSGIQVSGADCSLVCCEANGNDTNGFNVGGAGCRLVYCKAEDNGADGFSVASAASVLHVHCLSFDNTSDGFSFSSSGNRASYVRCVAYGNNSVGFVLHEDATAVHCTAYNNGSHGFSLSSDFNLVVKTSAWSNGGFGINYDEATSPQRDLVITPWLGTGADANTSGPFDADDGGTDTGVWDYTGIVPANLGGDAAPQYGITFGPVGGLANVVSGTDLTPLVGSGMIDAGVEIPYTARGDNTADAGAIESAGNAAAGGSLSPNILGVM
jgi:hypothetical protein